jgi:hypothetical protein
MHNLISCIIISTTFYSFVLRIIRRLILTQLILLLMRILMFLMLRFIQLTDKVMKFNPSTTMLKRNLLVS